MHARAAVKDTCNTTTICVKIYRSISKLSSLLSLFICTERNNYVAQFATFLGNKLVNVEPLPKRYRKTVVLNRTLNSKKMSITLRSTLAYLEKAFHKLAEKNTAVTRIGLLGHLISSTFPDVHTDLSTCFYFRRTQG